MGRGAINFSITNFGVYPTPSESSGENNAAEPASVASSESTMKGAKNHNLDREALVREVFDTFRNSGFFISGMAVPEPKTPLICKSCGVGVESEEQLQKVR